MRNYIWHSTSISCYNEAIMSKHSKPVKRDLSHSRQFPGQHDDEKVLAVVRQFIVALRHQIVIGGMVIVLVMLPWSLSNNFATGLVGITTNFMLLGFLAFFGYALWQWASWYYSVFILTSSRLIVIKQRGFFNRQVSELALNNVQSVNYHINGFNASVFGYGNVRVQTLSGSGDLDLNFVHHPAVFQQQILSAVHAHGSTAEPTS